MPSRAIFGFSTSKPRIRSPKRSIKNPASESGHSNSVGPGFASRSTGRSGRAIDRHPLSTQGHEAAGPAQAFTPAPAQAGTSAPPGRPRPPRGAESMPLMRRVGEHCPAVRALHRREPTRTRAHDPTGHLWAPVSVVARPPCSSSAGEHRDRVRRDPLGRAGLGRRGYPEAPPVAVHLPRRSVAGGHEQPRRAGPASGGDRPQGLLRQQPRARQGDLGNPDQLGDHLPPTRRGLR